MKDDKRQNIALFRYSVLAPLISQTFDETKSLASFFLSASKNTYTTPDGRDITFAPSSIQRWYYTYLKEGFEGLYPKARVDCGHPRKLTDDAMEQIKYLKLEYPRLPATVIHQKLMDNGTCAHGEVSLSTVTRFINQLALDAKYTTNKDRRRFEHSHINEVWYTDTTVAVYPKIDGKKQKTYIIACMCDFSRYITCADIFFADNFINVMSVLKSAVMRAGVPKVFTFDNGRPYKNTQMDLLMARIGSTSIYCTPYEPHGKSKLERWFKTMKNSWMAGLNLDDFKSLNDLKKSLGEYVNQYNKIVHSSLNGATPEDRFFSEAYRIKRLADSDIETSFLLEEDRRVSADAVIVLNDIPYEVHHRFIKQKIKIRYAPDLSVVYVVDKHSHQLEEIKLLDKGANAKIKRTKPNFTGGEA